MKNSVGFFLIENVYLSAELFHGEETVGKVELDSLYYPLITGNWKSLTCVTLVGFEMWIFRSLKKEKKNHEEKRTKKGGKPEEFFVRLAHLITVIEIIRATVTITIYCSFVSKKL